MYLKYLKKYQYILRQTDVSDLCMIAAQTSSEISVLCFVEQYFVEELNNS